MRLGFIGLGNIGEAIAQTLVSAGHELTVHDIRASVREQAIGWGATPVATAAEVANGTEMVLLSLPDQIVVEDVALGDGALLDAMQPGTVLVDLSTSLPAVTRHIAEVAAARSVEVMDAPVSGGREGAEAGKLTVMAGGHRSTFDRVKPVLEGIGDPQKVFYVGELGAGNAMKLCHSLINGTTLVAISEAMVLGCREGISPQTMYDIISVSRGNSGIFQREAPKILAGDFDVGFSINLMHKDVKLATLMAQARDIPTFAADAAKLVYEVAKATGRGQLEMSGVVTVLEEWAGVEVRSPKGTSHKSRST